MAVRASILAAGLTLGLLIAAPVAAQVKTLPGGLVSSPDVKTLAAWNGIWVIADSFMDRQDGTSVATGGGRRNPNAIRQQATLEEPVFKGEALKRFEAYKIVEAAAEAAGKPLQRADGQVGGGCGPIPFIGQWMTPYATELTLGPTQMILYQEAWQQVRHIYLDGRPHPDLADYDPKWKGHSVGHWEGDTLVIDTVGVKLGTSFYSDKLHIVERYRMTKPDYLTLDVVIDDAEALAKPRKLHYVLHRKAGMETMDYDCQENDRNPTGPNGETLTIIKSQ